MATPFQTPLAREDPMTVARQNLARMANIPSTGYTTQYSSPDTLLAMFKCIYSGSMPSHYQDLNILLSSYAKLRLGFYADKSNAVPIVPIGEDDTSYLYGRNTNPEANLLERQKKWLVTLAWSAREASVVSVQRGAEFFVEDSVYTADYLLALSHEWMTYSSQSNHGRPINVTEATVTNTWFKRSDDDTIHRITGHKSHAFVLSNSKWRLGGIGYPGTEPLKETYGNPPINHNQLPLVTFPQPPPKFIYEYSVRSAAPENQLYVTSIWDMTSQNWKLLGIFLAPEDIFYHLDQPWRSDPYLADDLYLETKIKNEGRKFSPQHTVKSPMVSPSVFGGPGLGITAEENAVATTRMGLSPQLIPQHLNNENNDFSTLPKINVIGPTPTSSMILGQPIISEVKPKNSLMSTTVVEEEEYDTESDDDHASQHNRDIKALGDKLENMTYDGTTGTEDEDYEDDEEDMSYYDRYDKSSDEEAEKFELTKKNLGHKATLETLDENSDDEYFKAYENVETVLNGDFSQERLTVLQNGFRAMHGVPPGTEMQPKEAPKTALHSETNVIPPPPQPPKPSSPPLPTKTRTSPPSGYSSVSNTDSETDISAEFPGSFPRAPRAAATPPYKTLASKQREPTLPLETPPPRPPQGSRLQSGFNESKGPSNEIGRQLSAKGKSVTRKGTFPQQTPSTPMDSAATSGASDSTNSAPLSAQASKQMVESHIKTTIGSLYQVARAHGIDITQFLSIALDAASHADKESTKTGEK